MDLKHSLRGIFRKPGFSIAVVLCLALGIGANSTVFSISNALLFKVSPVKDPETLVRVYTSHSGGLQWGPSSYPDFFDYHDRNDVFSDLVSEHLTPANLKSNERRERIWGAVVSDSYFSALGIKMARGAGFAAQDVNVIGPEDVVILSYRYWKNSRAGDPGVIGKSIVLNGIPLTVVGIAAEGFNGLDFGIALDFWCPVTIVNRIVPVDGEDWREKRNTRMLSVHGRLRPGVDLPQAAAALKLLAKTLAEEHPSSNRGTDVVMLPESEANIPPNFRIAAIGSLAFLAIMVGFVLLAACASVAGLLLARAAARHKETAIRLSLGASRGRLVRQPLLENTMLALIAAVAGLLFNYWTLRFFSTLRFNSDLPIQMDFVIDSRVILFTLGVSLFTTIAFGLFPVLATTKVSLVPALKEDIPQRGTKRSWARNLLVTIQVGVSLFLLMIGGILLRNLQRAYAMDLGFDESDVVVGSVDLEIQSYTEPRARQFFRQLLEGVRAISGVEAVSLGRAIPLSPNQSSLNLKPVDYESPAGEGIPLIEYNVVSPKYFEALRIPFLQGRDFEDYDTAESSRVAIINKSMSDRFWPKESAIGKFVLVRGRGECEVVGVVGDIKYTSLGESPKSYVYLPFEQFYTAPMTIHVRFNGEPAQMLAALRREVEALDGDLPIFGVQELSQQVNVVLGPVRGGARWVSIFGVVVLVMTAVGLYGLISYSISQRRREIGIRIALGAPRRAIFSSVVGQGVLVTVVGLVLGFVAAYPLSRFVSSRLYGVDPMDAISLIGSVLLVSVVSFTANLIPAIEATKIEPMAVLADE
jgi:predicted permease